MQIIVENDIEFYDSSKKSIQSFIGTIGVSSGDSFFITEGLYDIDINLDQMIEFSNKHDINFNIVNGKVYLS